MLILIKNFENFRYYAVLFFTIKIVVVDVTGFPIYVMALSGVSMLVVYGLLKFFHQTRYHAHANHPVRKFFKKLISRKISKFTKICKKFFSLPIKDQNPRHLVVSREG